MIFRYILARLRYWDPATVGYLKMGLAIDHRARFLAAFWSEHLQRTRSVQARWASTSDVHGKWLTVLGAGRMIDFNRTVLVPRFQRFRLVDADPLCRYAWEKFPKPVKPVRADISGCVDKWLAEMRRGKKRPWKETLAGIRKRRAQAHSAYTATGAALLSLNILSQLQIVWQDGVEEILERRFGKAFLKEHEEEWLDALRPSGQSLVEQHLDAMERSEAQHVLLITDLDYLEYKGTRFDRDRWAPPPVEWTPESGWTTDKEITCELTPALEGLQLNEATFQRWMPSYRFLWHEAWLWHIAPLGTEEADFGKVHRVGAFALARSGG